MAAEYLLFDLAVLAGPVALGFFGPTFFRGRSARAFIAALIAAIPFLIWDVAVADTHWFFSPERTLGWRPGGLPIEEWLFFLAVPYALIFSWEMFLGGPKSRRSRTIGAVALGFGLCALALGVWQLAEGRGYTGLTGIALGLVAVYDARFGGQVAMRRNFVGLVAIVVLTTVIFDSYLTARPVVTYDDAYNLGVRVGTVPVEDFGYGLASAWLASSIYAWLGAPNFMDRAVARRFGGYRHRIVEPALREPFALEGPSRPRVAVIGAGIAGMRTASLLAERGFEVDLIEKNTHLGGKIGGWTERHQGVDLAVEHGFHAFFRQYYNLDRWLHEVGIREDFVEIEDYAIVGNDGREHGFDGIRDTPLLNLLSLLGKGMFTLGDVAFNPRTHRMQAFLEWDKEDTYARFDETSFADFARDARLPPNLMLVFNSFSRAFFAPPEDMSMAELIKSFHFYFLSHAEGLRYDYPTGHYETAVLAPLRAHLDERGVKIELGRAVGELRPEGEAMYVDDTRYDHVVLAADVVGTRAIVGASPQLQAAAPRLAEEVGQLKSSTRYAVLRIWTDRRAGDELPAFVITEGFEILDSISFYHRIDEGLGAWAEANQGGVYELHAYSIPEDFPDDEAAIQAQLIEELQMYVPALRGLEIRHAVLQVNQNFTALHVGQHARRPGTRSDHPALTLAGDWVDLPVPAMLMEAACTSGIYAANAILEAHGLRQCLVESVPLQGLLVARTGQGEQAAS